MLSNGLAVDTKSGAPSLLVLNDYCLERILAFLNTIDQYKLSKLHSRLHIVVRCLWKMHLKDAHFHQDHFMHYEDDEFLDFMQSISPYVQSMTLHYLERRRFQLLSQCRFMKVLSLDCVDPFELHRDNEARYSEDDILVIQRSFPNLVALKVKGFRITYGRYLFGMKNLKKLQLNFL